MSHTKAPHIFLSHTTAPSFFHESYNRSPLLYHVLYHRFLIYNVSYHNSSHFPVTPTRPAVIFHPLCRSKSPSPPIGHPAPILAVQFTPPHPASSSTPSSGQIHPSPPSGHSPLLLAVKFLIYLYILSYRGLHNYRYILTLQDTDI